MKSEGLIVDGKAARPQCRVPSAEWEEDKYFYLHCSLFTIHCASPLSSNL